MSHKRKAMRIEQPSSLEDLGALVTGDVLKITKIGERKNVHLGTVIANDNGDVTIVARDNGADIKIIKAGKENAHVHPDGLIVYTQSRTDQYNRGSLSYHLADQVLREAGL